LGCPPCGGHPAKVGGHVPPSSYGGAAPGWPALTFGAIQ